MKKICSYLTIPILLFAFPSITVAATLTLAEYTVDNGAGNSFAQSDYFWGLPVTTPGGGPWNNITFNLYDDPTHQPFAFGDLFLFSSAYNGTPSAMSNLSTGYLASASSSGTEWIFDSVLQLLGDTTYHFYTKSARSPNDVDLAFNPIFPTPAGQGYYFAQTTNVGFSSLQNFGLLNFTLKGSEVPVPEPATLLLLGTGLLGLWGYRKRQSAC